jgi:hypothetical protein
MEAYPITFTLDSMERRRNKDIGPEQLLIEHQRETIYNGVLHADPSIGWYTIHMLPGLSPSAVELLVKEIDQRFPGCLYVEDDNDTPLRYFPSIPIRSKYIIMLDF